MKTKRINYERIYRALHKLKKSDEPTALNRTQRLAERQGWPPVTVGMLKLMWTADRRKAQKRGRS